MWRDQFEAIFVRDNLPEDSPPGPDDDDFLTDVEDEDDGLDDMEDEDNDED